VTQPLRSLADILSSLRLTNAQLHSLTEQVAEHWLGKRKYIRRKYRDLLLPSRLLVFAQERLLTGPLATLPIHAASYCEKGRGCVAAARKHARHPLLLHLDIKNFFPSVTPQRVHTELKQVGFLDGAASLVTNLTTAMNCLPQGASTSVAIANLVLGRLDGRLHELCRQRGLTYTRYIDDLGISGGERIADAEELVRRIVADEGWSLGETKGGLLGRNERHRYLGIVLNASPNVARDYIRELRFVITSLGREPHAAPAVAVRRLQARIEWVIQVNPTIGRTLQDRAESVGLLARPRPRAART
jgi:hypothetical protein